MNTQDMTKLMLEQTQLKEDKGEEYEYKLTMRLIIGDNMDSNTLFNNIEMIKPEIEELLKKAKVKEVYFNDIEDTGITYKDYDDEEDNED